MGRPLYRVEMGVTAVQPLLIIHIKILNMMPTFLIMMNLATPKPTQTIRQETLKVHTHMEPAGSCRKYPLSLFHWNPSVNSMKTLIPPSQPTIHQP